MQLPSIVTPALYEERAKSQTKALVIIVQISGPSFIQAEDKKSQKEANTSSNGQLSCRVSPYCVPQARSLRTDFRGSDV